MHSCKFKLLCASDPGPALAALLCCAAGSVLAQAAGPLAGQVVKIAHIDPFSGPFANVGQNQLKSWQFVAEKIKGAGNPAGVTFQIEGFDNKGSPQESLNALKSAIDQGYRYVTQGNGSGAALAISDAVAKYNERNPGKEVLYINYAAVDPAPGPAVSDLPGPHPASAAAAIRTARQVRLRMGCLRQGLAVL